MVRTAELPRELVQTPGLLSELMRLHAFEDLHVARGAKRTEHGADRKASFLRDCRKRRAFVPTLRQTPGVDFDPWTTEFHATPARRLLARPHTVGDQAALEFRDRCENAEGYPPDAPGPVA